MCKKKGHFATHISEKKFLKMKKSFFSLKKILAAALILAAAENIHAQIEEPLFHWRTSSGDSLLNFNPAAFAGGGTLLQDSIPYAEDYTVIVVYKPVQDTEVLLWSIDYGDGGVRGFTTEHILTDSISIRYAPQTTATPAISTLRQSAPDSVSPYAVLAIGGASKVAELLYYGRRLGVAELRRVQSLLAVRYGITLGPVDWRIGDSKVWTYDSTYRYRVTGVGTDTASGLCQTSSLSEMDGALLSVTSDTLPDGTFLLVGDDGGALGFEDDGDAQYLGRRWKIRATRACNEAFTLTFDTRDFASAGDTLVLLVDSDIYLPTTVSGDRVVFSDVVFCENDGLLADTTAVCYMTLGRGDSLMSYAQHKSRCFAAGGDTGLKANIYPNPTSGHYTLEVSGARQVQVTIYNVQGAIVAKHSQTGVGACLFEGELPTGSVYYATVNTENGSQTLKLVVR